MKTIALLTALTLTSCTMHRLITGAVKKEPQVYWPGVVVLAVSSIVLMNIKFKEQ